MPARRFRLWVAAFAAALVSCAPATNTKVRSSDLAVTPFTPPTATSSPSSRESPTALPSQVPRISSPLIDQAVADLAARLGVPASDIEVVSEDAVMWNDGSLGCPQPGMSYVQVLIGGFRIILKHGENTYDYHAGPSTIFLCERVDLPRKLTPVPGTTGALPTLNPSLPEAFLIGGIQATPDSTPAGSEAPEQYRNAVVTAASADLAKRLGAQLDAINVVANDYLETQPASPCGIAAKSETGAVGSGLSMGYEVVLRAGEKQYRYVAVGGLGYYCGEM